MPESRGRCPSSLAVSVRLTATTARDCSKPLRQSVGKGGGEAEVGRRSAAREASQSTRYVPPGIVARRRRQCLPGKGCRHEQSSPGPTPQPITRGSSRLIGQSRRCRIHPMVQRGGPGDTFSCELSLPRRHGMVPCQKHLRGRERRRRARGMARLSSEPGAMAGESTGSAVPRT